VNSASVDVSIGNRTTNGSGIAFLDVTYPTGGDAYAYYARAVYTAGNPQNIASNPLQLTVGSNTTLLLTLDREDSGNTHTFTARLVKDDRNGLDGRLLKLKLNDTEYEAKNTQGGGYSTWTINFSPKTDNGATTYNVIISFNGDSNKTATAYLTTPNGTRYAVCTTIQYMSYKPSANSTSIYVYPQTTTGTTTLKSPEETQKEVGNGGWLSVWHEFGWWWPFYKLHIVINVNPAIDIGFNPILPGGETWNWQGLELFADVLKDMWDDVMLDFICVFLSYVAAKGFGMWNWAAGLLIEGIKGAVQYGFFFRDFFQASAGSLKVLAAGLANLLMGLIAICTNVGEAFVKALQHYLYGPIFSVIMLTTSKMIAFVSPFKIIRTPVDYVESFIVDFPIAIFALLRYIGWI
jgi:hypothetical protein